MASNGFRTERKSFRLALPAQGLKQFSWEVPYGETELNPTNGD
jgi:hypothetical protein